MNAVYQNLGRCPCDHIQCKMMGTKLKKDGHLVGCGCPSCQGTRSRRKGHAGQAKGHRALGGEGFTPSNEETVGGYDIRVQVEHKSGYPKSTVKLRQFIETQWFRRALDQANRARRVGDGSMPAVMIDGRWLLVDCKKDKEGVA